MLRIAPRSTSAAARVLALLTVAASIASGCGRAPPPAPSGSTAEAAAASTAASPAAPAEIAPASAVVAGEAAGITYLERVTAGAAKDARLPLIVAVHGMGDRPEGWVSWWDDFPVPARVILPRAPTPYGDGYSWFHYPPAPQEDITASIKAAGDGLAATIAAVVRARPTVGKPIVTGFSQGGILSFEIAARHPAEIAAAFPLSGGLPVSLVPDARFDAGATPPIVAVHGDADRVVPIRFARDAIARLRVAGFDARLEELPQVGHTVTRKTRAEIGRMIAATARDQR